MSPAISYTFIPDGTVPSAIQPGEFYVDVGSLTHPQVFDHHDVGNSDAPAAAVWQARETILEQGRDSDEITIYTHQYPDWNGCWGACLLEWILTGQELVPEKIQALNTYSSFILTGFNPSDGPVEQSAMAVFESLLAAVDEEITDPYQRDLQKIDVSKTFFQFCYDSITGYSDLKSGQFLTEDSPFGRTILTVREDYQVYLHDLREAYRFIARVKRKSGQEEQVDGLQIGPPNSRLFKFWARSDTEHTTFKAGFPLLWVQWEPNRWIISVNPASGYQLQGLGDLLTEKENRLAPPDPAQANRDGYNCPNPWYDARNTPNKNTIVDSPSGGTTIPPKKVEKLLYRFFKIRKKRPAIEKSSWLKDSFIPYGVPLITLLVVAAFGWLFFTGGDQGCEQLRNLPELDINQGRHIAISIGITDYENKKWPDLKTPVADARDVMEILTGKYRFEPIGANGSILMVSDGKLPPTFDNIKNTILSTAENLTPNDSLLIYFAGHGAGSKNDTFGRWIPSDGDSKATAKCIENSWLQRVIEKCQARHILIIADCCFAGKLFDNGIEQQTMRGLQSVKAFKAADDITASYNLVSRQGLTSGNLTPVPDGTGHSPFAAALLKAMHMRDPYLTARKLYSKINSFMVQQDSTTKPYFYVIEETCDQQGEFVFRRR